MHDNPWLERRVIAYAHQGGAKEAPSSTLYAIRQALEHGATGIELDVHVTSDGQLVVCHDPTLDRTTNATGEIANTRLDELRHLDNAYWFLPGEDAVHGYPSEDYVLRGRAPGERDLCVATLAEVLERFPGVVLNLDIKRSAPDVSPYEEALARVLREHDREDDVIVASFLDKATEAFARCAPGIGISAGTDATTEFYRRLHAGQVPQDDIGRYVALQVPARFGQTVVVDQGFVEAAHASGLAVHVWTIDDPEEMERLVDLGVDGIISDKPTVLAGVLARLGANWKA
ncbi:MAG TPA: glycerophosphodiester phosphodiesterase [Acidimicrobiales bacterium]|nr:glycerophosphodiester phosphodiesterase [Acidimicrobiales bacterium]